MRPFELRMAEPTTIIMDGGMGGAIEDAGVDVKNPLWGSVAVLTEAGRDINDRIHQSYSDAGAELLIANTHNASLANAAAYAAATSNGRDPHDLMRETNERAIDSARARGAFVAGCLASPDVPYTTLATLDPEEIAERLTPQFDTLLGLQPDVVLFEMLTTSADVLGVARLLRARDAIAGVGLVCGDDGRMLGGMRIADAVDAFAGVASTRMFFIQCTRYTDVAPALAALVEAAPNRVVGVYANDGREWHEGAWHGERVTPEDYARVAVEWQRAGAKIIGGCCGTGPEHIAALRRALIMPGPQV